MMTAPKGERIDKLLWSVRLFKSRSAATEACRKGRVSADGVTVKPSHTVSEGCALTVRRPPATYTYLLTAIPPGRVGAKLVNQYISDLTPEEEKNKVTASRMSSGYRPKGSGRPTKHERRELDDFLE